MGTDEAEFDRRCIIAPSEQLVGVAAKLTEGLEALMAGREVEAKAILAPTDFAWPEFYEPVKAAGKSRYERFKSETVAALSAAKAPKRPTLPQWLIDAVFARDGWRCRYCDLRVIPASSRKAIVSACPELFRWGRCDADCHTGLWALHASHDHVTPHSAGGQDTLDNLVTACWTCQFQKGSYALAQLGLDPPGPQLPLPDGSPPWDGLESLSRRLTVWAASRGRDMVDAGIAEVHADAAEPPSVGGS